MIHEDQIEQYTCPLCGIGLGNDVDGIIECNCEKASIERTKQAQMKKEVIEMNKKTIFDAFNRLGYKLYNGGCGHYYFQAPGEKCSDVEIWFPSDGDIPYEITIKPFGEYNGTIYFSMERCQFQWLESGKCISLVTKGVVDGDHPAFINFSNRK
jgi:hypothetical protein